MSYLRRILVVDDSIHEIRVLVSMLRHANYELIIATNGRDACNRAGVLKPDLILLDVRMPVLDGLATCRILKAHPDTWDIPVIFLTAANDLETRLEGLRLGACDFITKPANEEEVLLRIAVHTRQPKEEVPVELPEGSSKENASVVTACVRLMEHDLSWTPTTEDIVHRTGISRHRINLAFKEVFGTSMVAWLRERRMQQATAWLAETNTSVATIAASLGFTTSGNFATAFKERFGMSPRDYRHETQERRLSSPSSPQA